MRVYEGSMITIEFKVTIEFKGDPIKAVQREKSFLWLSGLITIKCTPLNVIPEYYVTVRVIWVDTMSTILKTCFWPERGPCGVPPQQNIGFEHIPEYSRLKWDQI